MDVSTIVRQIIGYMTYSHEFFAKNPNHTKM